jgi:hypothetical protein
MTRTRIKGCGMKAISSPDTEPNFYRMEYCPVASDSLFSALLDSPSPISNEIANRTQKNSTDLEESKDTKAGEMTHGSGTRSLSKRKSKRLCQFRRMHDLSKRTSKALACIPRNSSPPVPTLSPVCHRIPGSREPMNETSGVATKDSSVHVGSRDSLYWRGSYPPLIADESTSHDATFDALPLDVPCSGDIVYFEGRQFCYLDHVDFDFF